MGFRNPVTSLAASQITGQLQGSQLAADAIDGKTITGALIRTRAAGLRAEISTDAGVQFRDDDAVYGGVAFGKLTNGEPTVTLDTGGYGHARIRMNGDTGLAASQPATVAIDGALVLNGLPYATQKTWRIDRVSANPFDTWAAGTGFVGMVYGGVTGAPAGDYLITLTLVLAGSAAQTPANVRLTAAGSSLGDPRCDLDLRATPYTFAMCCTHPGGDLALFSYCQLITAGQSASIYKAGSTITAAYLGPRS